MIPSILAFDGYRTTSIRATSYYWANEIVIGPINRGDASHTRHCTIKAHYYNYLVEEGRTITKDALIEESTLNEVVHYLDYASSRFFYQ